MSLINDALKKAREDGAANASPGHSRVRREEAAPSQGKLVALALAMGGVIIILLSVIIVALLQLFRAPAPTAGPANIEGAKPSAAPAPVLAEATPPEPLPAVPALLEKPAAELPPPAPVPLPPEAVPASVPSAPEALPAEPAPPPEPVIPEADPKIAEFIQSIQIRGIGKAKILLFVPGTAEAVAYVEGDAIDCAYELVIVSLTSRSLVFEDARGVRYTKPL